MRQPLAIPGPHRPHQREYRVRFECKTYERKITAAIKSKSMSLFCDHAGRYSTQIAQTSFGSRRAKYSKAGQTYKILRNSCAWAFLKSSHARAFHVLSRTLSLCTGGISWKSRFRYSLRRRGIAVNAVMTWI